MRIRKKKWVSPYLESESKYLIRDNIKDILNTDKKIILELGMGMGDFLSQSAHKNKDNLYIGYEKVDTCVAKTIMKFEELDLDNAYVILDDVSNLLNYFDHNIDVIYLQFSDPWPKKGHQKRRLTHPNFLSLYDKVLKDDGLIIFKTDNSGLFDYSIMSFLNNGYKLIDFSTDRHKVANDDIMTGYETKFYNLGQAIYYAVFKRSGV